MKREIPPSANFERRNPVWNGNKFFLAALELKDDDDEAMKTRQTKTNVRNRVEESLREQTLLNFPSFSSGELMRTYFKPYNSRSGIHSFGSICFGVEWDWDAIKLEI